MATVGDVLHDYIFSGGINKGGTWGGMDCFLHIPLEVHRTELVLWFALLAAAFVGLKLYDHVKHLHRVAAFVVAVYVQSPTERALDVAFAVVHFGNWLLVLYYKIHLHSLVNLLQPCHLLLFLQGLGVVSNGPLTALLGALTFPWVVGAVMGLVVPATEGLDQPFEYEQFFVQHWLMVATGLHLLMRNNRVAYRLMSAKTLALGNGLLMLMHAAVYAPMDRHFMVNVQFQLCPSEGLEAIVKSLPSFLVWPSYRTPFGLVGISSSYVLYYALYYPAIQALGAVLDARKGEKKGSEEVLSPSKGSAGGSSNDAHSGNGNGNGNGNGTAGAGAGKTPGRTRATPARRPSLRKVPASTTRDGADGGDKLPSGREKGGGARSRSPASRKKK